VCKASIWFFVLLLAACTSAPRVEGLPGAVYAGTERVRGVGDERQLRITLRADGAAAVQTTFPQRTESYFAEGTWQQVDGDVVLDFAGVASERLVFSQSGDLLIARKWDSTVWGQGGPGVVRRVR
jgi:hypothetical protein